MQSNLVLDPSTTGPIGADDRRRVSDIMAADAPNPGGSGSFIYTRYWNPTVEDTEKEIVRIEGGVASWAALTSSGMSAIDCALSVLAHPDSTSRPWLFANELYRGTLKYANEVLSRRRGIPIRYVELDRLPAGDATERFVNEIVSVEPPVILFEPVTNPTLIVLDIAAIVTAAHRVGSVVIVDNTFATAMLARPLDAGADMVVHSVTKYLAGHGKITARVVCGHTLTELPSGVGRFNGITSFEAAVRDYRKTVGINLGPREAFELRNQLRTFGLRVRAANENAAGLARFFVNNKKVQRVIYPGLPDHPNYDAALRNFGNRGLFGAVVTIELADDAAAQVFMDASELHGISYRMSLGDLDTTLLKVPDVFGRAAFGDHPGLLRISVGAEPIDELEAAFSEGLARI
jgi:cystathionine beta-lyase/cystathionine gamma-synthase